MGPLGQNLLLGQLALGHEVELLALEPQVGQHALGPEVGPLAWELEWGQLEPGVGLLPLELEVGPHALLGVSQTFSW